MNCSLLPKLGVQIGQHLIAFGDARDAVRMLLGYSPDHNKGRFDSEDKYTNVLDSGCRIRFSFENGHLEEIEFLDGSLKLDGIEMYQTEWHVLEKELKKKGYQVQKNDDGGWDILGTDINIGWGDDVGAKEDDDYIGWVYWSKT